MEELYKDDHSVGKDVAHHTVEVSAIHVVEHSAKEGIEHGMVPLLAPELAGAASHALGGVLHGFIAGAMASFSTHKAGKKEKDYKVRHIPHTPLQNNYSGLDTNICLLSAPIIQLLHCAE